MFSNKKGCILIDLFEAYMDRLGPTVKYFACSFEVQSMLARYLQHEKLALLVQSKSQSDQCENCSFSIIPANRKSLSKIPK